MTSQGVCLRSVVLLLLWSRLMIVTDIERMSYAMDAPGVHEDAVCVHTQTPVLQVCHHPLVSPKAAGGTHGGLGWS